MKKRFLLAASLILINQGGEANASSMNLEELLESGNPVETLKGLASTDAMTAKNLCDQILDNSFYDIASEAGLGIFARNKILNFCQGTEFDFANTSAPKQKDRDVGPEREIVQLRPVIFEDNLRIEDEQEQLRRVQEIILENAIRLGKVEQIETQMEIINQQIYVAEEHYNNLAVVVIGMREDLKLPQMAQRFQHFQPGVHEDVTPEEYIVRLETALEIESPNVLTLESKQQVNIASNLLKQAKINLELARTDLLRLNREMLELS